MAIYLLGSFFNFVMGVMLRYSMEIDDCRGVELLTVERLIDLEYVDVILLSATRYARWD